VYYFREELLYNAKENSAQLTAEMTTRTLGDENVQLQARELSRGKTHRLLGCGRTAPIQPMMSSTGTASRSGARAPAPDLCFTSAVSLRTLQTGVVYELLNDPHALHLTTQFLNQLLARDETRVAALDLLSHVFGRPEARCRLHPTPHPRARLRAAERKSGTTRAREEEQSA